MMREAPASNALESAPTPAPKVRHIMRRKAILEGRRDATEQRAICGTMLVPRAGVQRIESTSEARICDLCRVLYEARYLVELRGSNR